MAKQAAAKRAMERIAAITESMQTKPTRRPSSPSLRGRSIASTGDDKTRPHSALHSDDDDSDNDGPASESNRKAGQEQNAKARYDDRDIDKNRGGPTSSHTGAASTTNAVNKRQTVAVASEYDDDEFEFEAEEVRQQHK